MTFWDFIGFAINFGLFYFAVWIGYYFGFKAGRDAAVKCIEDFRDRKLKQ